MTSKTQIDNVTYDASIQSFQALVTFHTAQGRVRVATTFEAPLNTEFDAACDGLWKAARKMLDQPDALQSRLHARRVAAVRHQRSMPKILPQWLQSLTQRRAA